MTDLIKLLERFHDRRLLAGGILAVFTLLLLAGVGFYQKLAGASAASIVGPPLWILTLVPICCATALVLWSALGRPHHIRTDPLVGSWRWRWRFQELAVTCSLIDALFACRESGHSLLSIVEKDDPIRASWERHPYLVVSAIVWQLQNLGAVHQATDLLDSLYLHKDSWPIKSGSARVYEALPQCRQRFGETNEKFVAAYGKVLTLITPRLPPVTDTASRQT